MNSTSIIAELKEAREKNHRLTYEVIAAKLGVSFITVYRWMSGKTLPTSKITIERIEKFLRGKNGGNKRT